MWKRNIAVALGVFIISAASCFASAINIIVCQEEADVNTVVPVRNTTQQIESAIIDGLFDSGHIVTNESICNSDTRETGIENGLYSARESYMDFFVIVSVQYSGEIASSSGKPAKTGIEAIDSVTLTIRKIKNDGIICETQLIPVSKTKETATQELQRFGADIAGKICKEIAASK